jgi:hypothetical protein
MCHISAAAIEVHGSAECDKKHGHTIMAEAHQEMELHSSLK